jgi:putative polyhydroxyalkanoate system protein
MTAIRCSRTHGLEPAEARRRVDRIAVKMAERFGATCRWDGDSLKIEHASVHGRVTLDGHAVTVEAELGFPLSLMRGKATAEVERILEQELSS